MVKTDTVTSFRSVEKSIFSINAMPFMYGFMRPSGRGVRYDQFLPNGALVLPIGLMLVTLPVLAPFVIAFDINVIWFGVLVVKFIEIGLLTPRNTPVCLFVATLQSMTTSQFLCIYQRHYLFIAHRGFVEQLRKCFRRLSAHR